MKSSNTLRQGMLYGGVYILLLLLTIVLPVLSILSMVLLALPFFLFSVRNGWKVSFMFLGILSLISVFLLGIMGIPATLSVGLGGILLGGALHQGRSVYETWAQGTVGYVLGIVLFYLSLIWIYDLNLIEELQQTIDEAFLSSENMINSLGLPEEQLDIVQSQFDTIPSLLPSIMAVSAIGFSFITLWIGFKLLKRKDGKTYHFPPVRNLTFPRSVLWYYFIAVVLTWIFPTTEEYMGIVAKNMYYLTGFFMILQGFSYLFAWAHSKKRSNALPILGVVLTVLFPFLLVFPVRILGIIDLGFSLRERLEKK